MATDVGLSRDEVAVPRGRLVFGNVFLHGVEARIGWKNSVFLGFFFVVDNLRADFEGGAEEFVVFLNPILFVDFSDELSDKEVVVRISLG